MAEYIEREAALAFMNEVETCICLNLGGVVFAATKDSDMFEFLRAIPAADVAPVVRCKECEYFNDDDGDCRCVKDAEWDEETATWYGFVSYHMPDWFCAGGVRKDIDGE